MSADDYLLVRPEGDRWAVVRGVASTDYQNVESVHASKLEAVEAAQRAYPAEYGIEITDALAAPKESEE